ncbi:MAG: oligopeptide transport system permease protein, partial [Clostridiales bacterium]|nr:oligopeptide transport system permease protein [Clostridiales bacterium]
MGRYVARRFVSMIITLWFVITITFFLMHSIPGGPFSREKALPEKVLEALNEKYHLNDPLWKQYTDYLQGVVVLDFGPSFSRPGIFVWDKIKEGFPVSAKVGGIASLFVVLAGIPAGVISALYQNKLPDYIVTILATVGVAVPSFVVATLYIYVFSEKLTLVPAYGLEEIKSYIGPTIALAGFSLSFVARLSRSSLLEVMQQDYIRTARAKGLSELSVIFKHAIKNSLIPVITYMGPTIASILTGSFVVERIFAIPGMGKLFVESVGNRDYTMIMGTTIFYAAFAIIMIFLVDIAYGIIDPR